MFVVFAIKNYINTVGNSIGMASIKQKHHFITEGTRGTESDNPLQTLLGGSLLKVIQSSCESVAVPWTTPHTKNIIIIE